MSQYVIVNRTEKRKKRKKMLKRLLAVFVLLIFIAVAIALWIYWRSMTPTILDIAQVEVQSEATRAANEAVLAVFNEGVVYEDLVTVERNSQNEIELITANSIIVNDLARNTSLVTQSKINSLFEESISIPLGTLSGIPLLNNIGPNVSISVSPIGTATCNFVSKFESAGINQTLHRIYMNVTSKVDLIIPTMHKVVEITTPILICETVVVGKVPQTYLQGGLVWASAQK